MESIIPSLAYNSSCWSAIELHNLGSREITAQVEAHKSSGALASFLGLAGMEVHLGAGEHAEYKLQQSGEETTGAWVRVRETVPDPRLTPVLAVSGITECLTGDALRSTVRDVVWPTRNPWYADNVSPGDDGIIALINTSERPASVSGCYSSGVLYSVPGSRPSSELTPVCSTTINELIPPFGSRQFPVAKGGNPRFSLTARGEAIVLQMLRPAASNVKLYKVDSTITFGQEVPGKLY